MKIGKQRAKSPCNFCSWAISLCGVVAIIVCGFVFAGCENEDEVTDDNVAVASVTLDKGELSLTVGGEKVTLSATVWPLDADNKDVRWSTSDERKATVSKGTVTGVAEGPVTITVTTADGGKTATCNVTVLPPIRVDSVSLDMPTLTLFVKGNGLITPTVIPDNAYNKSINWTSSDNTKVTVINGTVTGVAEGEATITVTTRDGGKTATCKVTVNPVPVSDVTLDITTLNLPEGDIRFLTPSVLPANATYTTVSWSSDNNSVATVSDDGMVTALAQGTATITVTTNEGDFSDDCVVSVGVMPEVSGMVKINAGIFMMGSPGDSPGEEPWRDSGEFQHQVTLTRGFYMGIYPVTQEKYQAVVGANPSAFTTPVLPDETSTAKRPVEYVTWFDAVEFCNKLSNQEGLTPVYEIKSRSPISGNPIYDAIVTPNWNADGYRLPTEAEWEYACRAGTTTPFNFPVIVDDVITGYGTDTITTDQANYNGKLTYPGGASVADGLSRERTTEVDAFLPNEWGLYDMHGNVFEWCWDVYGSYAITAQTDPLGPAVSGSIRVGRAGSWGNFGRGVRSAFRSYDSPSSRSNNIGFRIVRSFVMAEE
jgi:uncharacterized protein YjdB